MQRRINTSPEEVQQWLTIDNDCPVFRHASDEDIVNNVTRTLSGADIECDKVDDTDEIVEVSEAIMGLESALSGLEMQEIDYVQMLHVRNVLDFAKSRRKTALKQLKLDA